MIIDRVCRHHGLPMGFFSHRDPASLGRFNPILVLAYHSDTPTVYSTHTNSHTERVHHVVEDTLRSVRADTNEICWISMLPGIEFAFSIVFRL